jgi:hypothetical protein
LPSGSLDPAPVSVTKSPSLTVKSAPAFATGARLFKLKFAVQDLFAVMVTDASEQSASPNHPENLEPTAALAMRVTS